MRYQRPSTQTALALNSNGWYYCCGKKDIHMSVYDAASGKRLREGYSHYFSSTVVALSWFDSGKEIVSCDDGVFIVACDAGTGDPGDINGVK